MPNASDLATPSPAPTGSGGRPAPPQASPPRVAVVVGAGPGLGMALARRFGARDAGHRVVLVGRSPDVLAGLVRDLGAASVAAEAVTADAGDAAALGAALADVERRLGRVDVLCYNAVGVHMGPPTALAAADLEADLRVGVVGAQAAALALLPGMRARGGGSLLFTGGGAAFGPSTRAVTLSAQKAALRNLVLSLAAELAGGGAGGPPPAPLRVGTVTVMGGITPGTPFAPDRIAAAFWALHTGAEPGPEVRYDAAYAAAHDAAGRP